MAIRKTKQSHIGTSPETVEMWHRMWDVLVSSDKPMSASDIAEAVGSTTAKVHRAMQSLSAHTVPIYDEKAGKIVYYGAARFITNEKVDELIGNKRECEYAAG